MRRVGGNVCRGVAADNHAMVFDAAARWYEREEAKNGEDTNVPSSESRAACAERCKSKWAHCRPRVSAVVRVAIALRHQRNVRPQRKQ
jgi:hypothetical protein